MDRRSFLSTAAGLAALALAPDALPAPVLRKGKQIPVAVIGIGRQGRLLLAELQRIDAVRVTAICDTDGRRLMAGARRTADAATFEKHTELLEKAREVQMIFVATPTHKHRQIVEDCLASGKHVYCEAPLAHTIEDAAAIARAARNASAVFASGLQGRLNPIYQLARTFFRSDSVRDLVSMRAQSNQKTSWRIPAPGGDVERERELNWRLDEDVSIGLAGELGTQQFDVFHWYTDEHPTGVRGHGSIQLHNDGRSIADTIHCELVWPNQNQQRGPQLHYSATLANSFERTHEVFYGSNAAIKLAWNAGWMFKEADAPTQGWEVYANRQQFHNDEGITLIADATQLAAQGKLQDGVGLPDPPLFYAVNAFIKSVVDAEPVVATAEVGYRATVVGILADRAVRSGKDIAIEPDLLRL